MHACLPACCVQGELMVNLREARNLPVWGFPGQSNPFCRLVLGEQVGRGGEGRVAGRPFLPPHTG